ncbi:raffinose/stachyose/melibiose transport system permease protein [Catenuloplanes nepalensis]|uniref:Raffinose/stachyose/melibiose transport system permease protein n=1 Tax=Catenuloplanes nepalensis TaxID=587533 RepID=A0ABT9MYY2_9ACTN|nr:sugar ABC transporter permease [Catenuloplanes nepalensis]MDP9796661.1 raffinose/stachyose/melibiose transport system permease protein [Catenuloplanes nepalensis]
MKGTPLTMVKTRSRQGGKSGYLLFLLPGVLLFTAVIIIPLIMNIGISFTRWQGIGTPQWVGLEHYERLIHDANFWASFRNILFIIVAMVVVPTLLGLFLAAVLFDYVGKKIGPGTASVFRSGLYLPQVLPVAVTGIVWGWFLNSSTGVFNSILDSIGLGFLAQNWLGDPKWALWSVMFVMVWVQLGYPVVMFMSGLQRVDPELYEAADLDGAGWWQKFTRIAIHLIKPEIYVVLVTTTISALKIFGQIFVLTRGGPGNSTLVPSYFAWQNFFEKFNAGYGAAISTVLTLIIIVLTYVFLRIQTADERRGA